ncbi:hypothetical protein RRG08_036430 [Elysia crispata]|uniref:Uncharacterized protein n=1 Tax=Elysia crispata TaxID=231223 RepID=A0AAE0ZJY2_9GAST|nr:hypothetical protein RRG08_036430 [Elysia crispata]
MSGGDFIASGQSLLCSHALIKRAINSSAWMAKVDSPSKECNFYLMVYTYGGLTSRNRGHTVVGRGFPQWPNYSKCYKESKHRGEGRPQGPGDLGMSHAMTIHDTDSITDPGCTLLQTDVTKPIPSQKALHS